MYFLYFSKFLYLTFISLLGSNLYLCTKKFNISDNEMNLHPYIGKWGGHFIFCAEYYEWSFDMENKKSKMDNWCKN